MERFSGTDYDKNPENPGICFPFLNAPENTPSFGSIVRHKEGITKLVHTEYRQVSGNVESKEGINYLHGKSITYVKGFDIEKPKGFDSWFQKHDDRIASYVLGDRINEDRLTDDLIEILDMFDETGFEPSLDLVFKENVTKQSYQSTHYGRGYTGKHSHTRTTIPVAKYGKSQSKTLIQMMIEEEEAEIKKDFKSDSEMIEEALAENIETYEALKDVKPVSDEEGAYPFDKDEMSAQELNEYCDLLRDELEGCGVDKVALATASDEQIITWSEALNLVIDVSINQDSFADVKDGTWNNKGA